MEHRLALRAATRLHEQILRRRRRPTPDLPESLWQQCRDLARRTIRAEARGLHLTAAKLADDFHNAFSLLHRRIAEEYGRLQTTVPRLPTVREIDRDLRALEEEFAEVHLDLANGVLSVETEPIVLEEIPLGPFEIQLHWDFLGTTPCYEVIAKDPSPAVANPGITHPHLDDGRLCEGDGRVAVRRALQEGRLLDFFQMVAGILRTYNAGSAYVSLEEWYGVPCADCGAVMDEEERLHCERSGDPLCLDCALACRECGHEFSSYYTTGCARCQGDVCSGCIQTCIGCNREVCPSCLNEGRCTDCHEPSLSPSGRSDRTGSEEPGADRQPAGPAAEPLRLGQAAVSAGRR